MWSPTNSNCRLPPSYLYNIFPTALPHNLVLSLVSCVISPLLDFHILSINLYLISLSLYTYIYISLNHTLNTHRHRHRHHKWNRQRKATDSSSSGVPPSLSKALLYSPICKLLKIPLLIQSQTHHPPRTFPGKYPLR